MKYKELNQFDTEDVFIAVFLTASFEASVLRSFLSGYFAVRVARVCYFHCYCRSNHCAQHCLISLFFEQASAKS